MKQNIVVYFNHLIFFGLGLLLTPPKTINPAERLHELKVAEKQQTLAIENTYDILHSEILFKY